MDRPTLICVGVDGSADSQRALAFAAELAAKTDAHVTAVHALGLLAHRGQEAVVPPPGYRQEVATLLAHDWSRPLAEAKVAYDCLIEDGPPVDALLHAARDQGATVIVVGRRGSGSSIGLPIGSTSQQLVHRSDVPVVVVP